MEGRKNIKLRKRNLNNVWDNKYVTYISKCESYTLYIMLQLICAISTSTMSFELLAIAISDCIKHVIYISNPQTKTENKDKPTKGRNIGDNLNRTQKVKVDRCKSSNTQKRKRH